MTGLAERLDEARAARWLPALLLALLTFAVYSPATRGQFIWDDDLLAGNPVLSEPGGLTRILTRQPSYQHYYRDVSAVYATFWIERRLWGIRPAGYHWVNIILHALNAILAWLILERLGLRGAWFAAAIFAVHPVQVESVAWIAERKNVLSNFFYLLSLTAYLRYEDDRDRRWYAAALALFPLALLSKPLTCVLPVIVLLLRWRRGFKSGRRQLVDLLPFFLAALAVGLFTLGIEDDLLGTAVHVSWAGRVFIAARALWFYPMTLAWPAGLSFSYDRWDSGASGLSSWLWLAWTLAAGGWIWRERERLGRDLLACLGFYALTISPLLGFVTIYTFRYTFAADHYQYLACLGLIAPAVGGAARLLRGRPAAGIVLGAVVVAGLGLAARRRTSVFLDSESLWRDAALHSPRSWLARNNLGFALAEQGRLDEAIGLYGESLRLAESPEAHLNLGIALFRKGRALEAEEQYRLALRGGPGWPVAHLAPYAWAVSLLGRGELEPAIARYSEVLALRPDYAQAHDGLGQALLKAGRPADAMFHFQRAIGLDPRSAAAQLHLGVALDRLGMTGEAVARFREALALEPGLNAASESLADALRRFKPASSGDPRAQLDLGFSLWAAGRRDEAAAQFRSALQARVSWSAADAKDAARAHNDLGAYLWGRGAGLEALAHYQDAVRLDPGLGDAYNNLGIVLLFQKKHEDAAAYFREALRRSPNLEAARLNLAKALSGGAR